MWISKLIAACTICVCPATIPVAEVIPPHARGYDEATNLPRGDSQFSLTDILIEENEELKRQLARLHQLIEILNEELANSRDRR